MNFWFIHLIFIPKLVLGWCLPLAGSTTCPAFAQYYAGMSQHGFALLTGVWNVTSFDQAMNHFVHNTFWDQFNCTSKPLYARYTLSVICEFIINDNVESKECNRMYNVTPPALCQDSCYQQLQDMKQVVHTQCMSTLPSNTLESYLKEYSYPCQTVAALNASSAQGCMLGMVNEPDNCGFSTPEEGCQYCRTNSDHCCLKIACDFHKHALSGGAIAGIVIATIVCILLLATAIYYYRRLRALKRNYQSSSDRSETACSGDKSITGPPLLEESDYYHASPAALRDTDSVGLISKMNNEFHTAVHQYCPSQPDELNLEKGDIIVSTVAFDDGWAVGVNITTGEKGAFPLVCVTPASREALEWLLTEVELNVDESASDQMSQIIRYQMRRSPPTLLLRHGTKIPQRFHSIDSQSSVHNYSSAN